MKMKMKMHNGITLVTLAITIVVLVIISSITIYTGANILDRANLQNLNTNMMLIQAKAKTIGENSKFNKDTTKLKGHKINEITENEKINKLIDEKIIEKPEEYYLLSQEDLNTMGLEKIKLEDGYIINYNTEEVIYVKGFEVDKKIYYKLSETKVLNIK